MDRYGCYYDQRRCIGCGACQVACKNARALKQGVFFRRVLAENDAFFSLSCGHCEEPACKAACRGDALYIASDGAVLHDPEKCIACGACTWACPYGAIALSNQGYAAKCDSCMQRRSEGRPPACVAACPLGALDAGSMDMLLQKYPGAVPFPPNSAQTNASVLIRRLQEEAL